MSIELKVTPEKLVQTANDIEAKIKDIRSQFAGIDSRIGGISAYWEGDAFNRHKTRYASMKEEIQEVTAQLMDHPVNLLKMANLYQETEKAQEAAAEPLPTDIIV